MKHTFPTSAAALIKHPMNKCADATDELSAAIFSLTIDFEMGPIYVLFRPESTLPFSSLLYLLLFTTRDPC